MGIKWQRDFFEHRLRSDESWREKADYILANPVRKGLVAVCVSAQAPLNCKVGAARRAALGRLGEASLPLRHFLRRWSLAPAAFLRRTSLALAAPFAATVVDGCGVPAAKHRRSLRRVSLTNR